MMVLFFTYSLVVWSTFFFFWCQGFKSLWKNWIRNQPPKKNVRIFSPIYPVIWVWTLPQFFFGRRQNLDGNFKYFLFSPYSTWGRNFHPILTCCIFFKKGLLTSTTNLEKTSRPQCSDFSSKKNPVILGVKSLPISFFGRRGFKTRPPNGGQHLRKRTFAHISQKTAFGAPWPQKRLGFVGCWGWHGGGVVENVDPSSPGFFGGKWRCFFTRRMYIHVLVVTIDGKSDKPC